MTTATRYTDLHMTTAPREYADLPEHDQNGEMVLDIRTQQAPFALLAPIGALMVAAEKAGLIVRRESYRTAAFERPTEEQIEQRLDRARERWDNAADRYDAATVSGTVPGDWSDKQTIESYCRKTGLTLPWNKTLED